MKKKFGMMALAMILTAGMLAGCGSEQTAESSDGQDAVTGAITVSAAASLTDVLNELAQTFQEEYPGTEVSFTFGGSGALQTQIEEGAPVDLFFSAAESNMDALEEEGLIDAATRKDVLQNEIVLIAPQGETAVTSFETAVFIKGNRKFTIPCTYPYYIKIIFIFGFYKLNKLFAVSFFLILGIGSNILYFYNIIPFLCDNTFRLYPFII